MKITHDRDANALYIYVSKGEFNRTQPVNENVFLDLDADGKVLGIEFIGVSQWVNEPTQAQVVDITRPRDPQSGHKPVAVLSEDVSN